MKKMCLLRLVPFILRGAISILLLSGNTAVCQTHTARSVIINSNCKEYYEYLPINYASGTQTYPLIIFIHGVGELGNGNTDLSKVLANGPPSLIEQKKFPVSLTVNGNSFSFIVISPQFVAWPSATDVNTVLDYAIANYRVDINRIYITGLSMGGGATWDYAGANAGYASRIAALLPVCGASSLSQSACDRIAASNLPVWATHNNGDDVVTVQNTLNNVSKINSHLPAPNPLAKQSIFNATGHNAWSRTYDPNWRDSGYNVYEWMLRYQRTMFVLPVKMKSFDVRLLQENTVLLTWVTEFENNSDYFSVQRSRDGINFESIGKVQAKGNSQTDNTYRFTDLQPIPSLNFYRLAETDRDYQTQYFEIRKLLIPPGPNFEIGIAPNPVFNNATLLINSELMGSISCTLLDMTGRIIRSYQFRKDQVYMQQILSMYNVPRGDYVLMVQGRDFNESLRISKK
jgi:hypothetical protein